MRLFNFQRAKLALANLIEKLPNSRMDLSLVFLIFLGALILLGGRRFEIGGARFELAQVDLWMLPLLIFLGIHKAEGAITWVQQVLESPKVRIFFYTIATVSVVALTFLHVFRHFGIHTQVWDVGSMHQGLYYAWNKSANTLLHCDVCLGGSNLGEHLVFTTFGLTPIFSFLAIFGNYDFLLFIFQSILLCIPFYFLVIKDLELKQSKQKWMFILVVCVLWLSQRWVRSNYFWDFREDVLAFVFLSISLFAQKNSRSGLYLISMILALLSKESVSVVAFTMGIALLLDQSSFLHSFEPKVRIRNASIVCVLSVFYLIFATRYLIPLFSGVTGQVSHPILFRFQAWGSTPAEVLMSIASRPWLIWPLVQDRLTDLSFYKYLFFLIAPIAYFLKLKRSWPWLIPLGAAIALNLIPEMKAHRSMQFHYELLLAPVLLSILVIGVKKRFESGGVRSLAIGLLIALCLSGRWPGFYISEYWPNAGLQTYRVSHYLRNLNFDGVVAINESWYAQVTHLKNLRRIQTPETETHSIEGDVNQIQAWLKLNNGGLHRTRGGALSDTRYFVLSRNLPWDELLHTWLIKSGAKDLTQDRVPENLRDSISILENVSGTNLFSGW